MNHKRVLLINVLRNDLFLVFLTTGIYSLFFDRMPPSFIQALTGIYLYGLLHIFAALAAFVALTQGNLAQWRLCLWVMLGLLIDNSIWCFTSDQHPIGGLLFAIYAWTTILRIHGSFFDATIPRQVQLSDD